MIVAVVTRVPRAGWMERFAADTAALAERGTVPTIDGSTDYLAGTSRAIPYIAFLPLRLVGWAADIRMLVPLDLPQEIPVAAAPLPGQYL